MLNLEILEPKTKVLFDKLANLWFPFVLAGWTWLSLQIWHRKSIDLDFVVPRKINPQDIQTLRKIATKFEIIYKTNEQIDMFIDGVKVTLFSYRWKEFFPLKKYKKLKIWDIRDIAISKASTIGRREELKDYVDIYFILKEWILSLDDLIKLSKKKFGWEFSEKLFLKQLLLIKNIEHYEIKYINKHISVDTMYRFFSDIVEKRLK